MSLSATSFVQPFTSSPYKRFIYSYMIYFLLWARSNDKSSHYETWNYFPPMTLATFSISLNTHIVLNFIPPDAWYTNICFSNRVLNPHHLPSVIFLLSSWVLWKPSSSTSILAIKIWSFRDSFVRSYDYWSPIVSHEGWVCWPADLTLTHYTPIRRSYAI